VYKHSLHDLSEELRILIAQRRIFFEVSLDDLIGRVTHGVHLV
jgi:hypothetical protein